MPRRERRTRRLWRRLVTTLSATVLVLAGSLVTAPASNAEICERLGLQARCRLVLGDPGNGGGGGGGNQRPICNLGPPDYEAVPGGCFNTVGVWSNEHQCYLGENNDEIDYSDDIWDGNTHGRIYDCISQDGVLKEQLWFAEPPTIEGFNPMNAAQLVLGLKFIAFPIGLAPSHRQYDQGSAGVVGMPVWMWAAGRYMYNYADPAITVTEPGTGYYVRAKTTHTMWDMGDGTPPIRCGEGTEYFPSFRLRSSPTCGHKYTKPGNYRVTITTYWNIEWVDANGYSSQQLVFPRSAVIRVLESQTVNEA